MAARARVRFSTSGASKVTGAFSKVGGSASAAGGKVNIFGKGVGNVFYKVMRNVGRMTMFSAGIQKMGKSSAGAKRDIKGFADGSVTALSGLSKKFAELRRQYYFFKFAGQKLAAPVLWATGNAKKKGSKGKEPEEAFIPRMYREATEEKEAKRKEILFRKFDLKEPKGVKKATAAWQKFFAAIEVGKTVIPHIIKKIFSLKHILVTLTASLVAIATAGGAAFVYLGYKTAQFAKNAIMDFMSIRESFRKYEISLGGIIRNTYSLGKTMKFATKYAAEYPAMFEEVLGTFRSLAALPALKPMFRKADEKDLKNIMGIIQGLATLDPIQGVEGAGIALREALSGDMRSVRKRFEIPPHAIAEAGGYSLNEITKDSQKALKAFGEFIKLNVPAKSMSDAAMTIGIQVGNLRDQYRSFVNEMMKSTGAYYEVVTALSDVNDWLTKVFASPALKKWAETAGKHMRAVVATIKSVLSDIDWDKYIGKGDLLGGIIEAAKRTSIAFKAIIEKWKGPFLTFVFRVAKVLKEGLPPIVADVIRTVGALFAEGFYQAGTAAGSWFIKGVARFLAKGVLPKGWLEAAEKKVTEYKSKKKVDKADKGGLHGLADKVKKTYETESLKLKPEIVTPELDIKEHSWHLSNLKQQITAYKTIGTSKEKLKSLTGALIEAEKNLGRAIALKKWRSTGGKELEEAQKKMDGYDKAILKASKAGTQLEVGFYTQKIGLQKEIDALTEMYDKTVEQKSAWVDLVSLVKSAPESLKEWIESYKIAKKDAGALLMVVEQLEEVASGKTVVSRNTLLDLLKKRIELTDTATKKEKEYKKELAKIPKAIAQNIAGMAGNLQSSILSFVDKLQGAFIGIPKFGGKEPEPISMYEERRPKTRKEREETTREKIVKAKREGRESDFRRSVLEKIGDMVMVPKDALGTGRKGMTYQEGLGSGMGGTTKIPPYIRYMLQGIQKAVGTQKGAGEFAAGRKALAGMKMSLLEKALPFTPHRSEERAGLYAKMAGAQTDFMKATMETVKSDIKMQRDQLTELQKTANNTKLALSKSDGVMQILENIAMGIKSTASSNKIPPVSAPQHAQTGNTKITQANPKTVSFEQGGYMWEVIDRSF